MGPDVVLTDTSVIQRHTRTQQRHVKVSTFVKFKNSLRREREGVCVSARESVFAHARPSVCVRDVLIIKCWR